jgi:anti-anti-sigma factor
MEVTVTKSEGITTVVLEGRLDTPASPEVSAKLEPVVQDASGTIILDCGKLTYI